MLQAMASTWAIALLTICIVQGCIAVRQTSKCGRTSNVRRRISDPLDSVSQRWSKRVAYGKYSQHGEWPWMVALMREEKTTRKQGGPNDRPWYYHVCGGTLIGSKWVLTAGHCFIESEGWSKSTYPPAGWIVRLGEHHLGNENVPHREVGIKKIHLGEVYKGNYIEDDIALLELASEVKLDQTVNIACLPSLGQRVQPGWQCAASGWGTQHKAESDNEQILRHVTVQTYPTSQCFHGRKDPLNKICAGHPKGKQSTCQGDSGGPLVCKVSGRWYLMGIVSSGPLCEGKIHPGLYTNVTHFIPWVRSIIKKN